MSLIGFEQLHRNWDGCINIFYKHITKYRMGIYPHS